MRSFVIRGVVVIAVLAVIWLASAPWWSLLMGEIMTIRIATLQSNPIGADDETLQFGVGEVGKLGPAGWNGNEVLVGAHLMTLEGPDYKPVATLSVDADSKLVLTKGAQRFVLGPRAGTVTEADGELPAYTPEPGDKASVTLERSLMSWPSFELNFMTGNSPSWKRHIYYRLTWQKASGARLDMLWRYEQGWDKDNGWRAPNTKPDVTGLIRVTIR